MKHLIFVAAAMLLIGCRSTKTKVEEKVKADIAVKADEIVKNDSVAKAEVKKVTTIDKTVKNTNTAIEEDREAIEERKHQAELEQLLKNIDIIIEPTDSTKVAEYDLSIGEQRLAGKTNAKVTFRASELLDKRKYDDSQTFNVVAQLRRYDDTIVNKDITKDLFAATKYDSVNKDSKATKDVKVNVDAQAAVEVSKTQDFYRRLVWIALVLLAIYLAIRYYNPFSKFK